MHSPSGDTGVKGYTDRWKQRKLVINLPRGEFLAEGGTEMHAYIVKRILMVVPTMIMVTILIFVILRLIPGDPALVLLHEDLARGGVKEITQEEIQAMRVKLGTDKPIIEQYGRWVWNMLQLDFGKSYRHENEIWDELRDKFPVTLELTVLALLMATIVAVPLGAISAIKQDTLVDYATRVITIAGIALPIFWVGTLIVFFLVLLFDWFPPLGYVELWEDPWANAQQLFFPALALGFSNMAFIARVTPLLYAGGVPRGLHTDCPFQRPRGTSGDLSTRPKERRFACGHRFRLSVRATHRRHCDHRDHISVAWDRQVPDYRRLQPRLRHGSGCGCGDNK